MTHVIVRDAGVILLVAAVLYLNVIRSNRRVIIALITPVALLLLHAVGNMMQEQSIGPGFVHDRLHDLGAPGYVLPSGLLVVPLLLRKRRYPANAIKNAREADQLMAAVLLGWMLGTIACIGYVVIAHTIGKDVPLFQHAEAAGWDNAVGYALAGGIMILNHIYMRRWVLKLPRGSSNTRP